MQALVENKVWTEAELMALPDDGRKYELADCMRRSSSILRVALALFGF